MKTIAGAFALFASTFTFGQDIHFSQMGYSPMNLNPALAGANFDMQAIVNYKSQWKSVATPYKTIGASFDMRLNSKKAKKGFLSAGLNFFSDQAGDVNMTTTNINLALAYHVRLNDKSLLGGALYGGWAQRGIDPAKGKWGSQYDGFTYDEATPSGETFGSEKFSLIDFGAGLVYTFRKQERYMTGNDQRWINLGVAAYHLNTPKYSYMTGDDKLYMRYSAFANALIGIGNSDVSLVPAVYYNMQGKARELLFGTYVKYMLKEESKYTGFIKASSASLGCFYRNKDAVVVKAMFEYSQYAIGFAYDLNTSSLSEVSDRKGGFEVFIRFVNPSPFNASKSRI